MFWFMYINYRACYYCFYSYFTLQTSAAIGRTISPLRFALQRSLKLRYLQPSIFNGQNTTPISVSADEPHTSISSSYSSSITQSSHNAVNIGIYFNSFIIVFELIYAFIHIYTTLFILCVLISACPFALHQWLDVRDSTGKWLEAQVRYTS